MKYQNGYFCEVSGLYFEAWNQYKQVIMDSEADQELKRVAENRSINCASQLNQWKVVCDYGRKCQDNLLLAEAYSHLDKWK